MTISGLLRAMSGEILFEGKRIDRAASDEIVAAGISHVPQGRRLFAGLTVRENLLQGAYLRQDPAAIRRDLGWVLSLFPSLQRRLHQAAGTLSGGEQQMCAIGRGLMARPKLLMIDEFSLGLAPIVVDQLADIVRTVNDEGMTVLMVEQDVQVALERADRGYVLETGHITLAGPAEALLANEHIKQAYLGI
jgi:branched-chain amino acid transport system ATP-binding protein